MGKIKAYLNKGISPITTIVIIAIIGILATAGILAYIYLWHPATPPNIAQDETANWKTYQNEEYGFEIKYPALWHLEESMIYEKSGQLNIVNNTVYLGEDESTPSSPELIAITIQFGKTYTQKTFEEFVKFDLENPERGFPIKINPISRIISGHNSFEIEKSIDNGKEKFYYIEQDSGHYLTIGYFVGNEKGDSVADEIISTFKFISTSTSLNVYRNEKYGYQLSIPQGWEIENTLGFEQKTITKKNKSQKGDYSMIISPSEWQIDPNDYDTAYISPNYLSNWIQDNYESDYYHYPLEPVNINGNPGYRTYTYTVAGGGIPTIDTFIATNGDNIFHFSCLINVVDYPTNNLIADSTGECDQMINSFKIN